MRSDWDLITGFAGGGGYEVGARMLDGRVKHAYGIEIDPDIAAVANKNGLNVVVGDMRSFDYSTMPYFDPARLITQFSPPCQRFSSVNFNGGETADDIDLARSIVRAVHELRPKIVTIENVKGYRKSKSWAMICDFLFEMGYWVSAELVDCAKFGVPQNRTRFIVRAVRHSLVSPLPDPVDPVGWLTVVEDLLPHQKASEFSPYQMEQMLEKNFPVGTDRPFLVSSTGSRVRARYGDEPAHTVVASLASKGAPYRVSWNGDVVKLDTRSVARLQTFPDSYWLPSNRSTAFTVIGNAVPPLAAATILSTLV